MENYNEVILSAAKELQADFKEHPYDFLSYEIEAQTRLSNILRKKVSGFMKGKMVDSSPPFLDEKACRVRLEWPVGDNRHDIVIIKESTFGQSREEIDAFIEIKTGWTALKGHFEHPQFLKDLQLLVLFPNSAYLFFFLGNEFENSKSVLDYKETHKMICEKNKILPGHLFIFLRDQIIY